MNLISLLIFILTFNAFGLTQDEEKKYDELEGLAFVQALSLDKKYEEVIKQYPGLSKKQNELGRLHFYLGEAHFNLKNYSKAFDVLTKGEKFERPSSDYLKLWAQTAAALKKRDVCSELYGRLKLQDINGIHWPIYFHCLKSEKALSIALKHNSREVDYVMEVQGLLIKNSLQHIAREKRRSFLSRCANVNDYFRLWGKLEEVELRDMQVLEMAHACHPDAIEITSLFIKNLFIEGQFHSIAYLFQDLSAKDKEYIKHTAEFYKVAGRNTIADYFFSLGDEGSFVLNRSSRLLNDENYAGLLSIPFKREMLNQKKDLAYALAYSYFKFLSLDASHATLLAQSKKNSKDEQLGGLIEKCRALGWRCRP